MNEMEDIEQKNKDLITQKKNKNDNKISDS